VTNSSVEPLFRERHDHLLRRFNAAMPDALVEYACARKACLLATTGPGVPAWASQQASKSH
jgi:hypothetical protein